ncbi:MAG: type IVB secretion system protein DotA [Legionellaceae bacterium]|nr:type IVB secretion system protein DotA [Legionellaceae bacterium]
MKRPIITLFLMLFPILATATSSLNFTPPATDYSVIFLSDLFGVVDGVLHGTGSQIMGAMFGVFNAAVLALGGIVVMYTLIVGTMNTAHEGQMLGQKWSSIWIPVRSTIGLAFLIPKASGYCLMQIFIMWVVVQGVGAADKIWDAALSYLNRGGSIVKAQMNMNSTTSKDNNTAITALTKGAGKILSGQVCMQGLQVLLTNQRTQLLAAAAKGAGTGACSEAELANTTNPAAMVYFCNNAVPNFISTVNAIDFQSKGFVSACSAGYKYETETDEEKSQSDGYELDMPNFNDVPYYSDLNGVCGTIKWYEFNPDMTASKTLSCSDKDLTRQSRAVAIQQMYSDLTPVAIAMVDNDPKINTDFAPTDAYSKLVAGNQFGIPYLSSGTKACTSPSEDCTNWGPDTSATNTSLIFTGYELQNALMDYNGIMLAALSLQDDLTRSKTANRLRAFISKSERQGWIMAGAYFFDLVNLNGMVTTGTNIIDGTSGLDTSDFSISKFQTEPFKNGGTLSVFFEKSTKSVDYLAGLINGEILKNVSPIDEPTVDTSAKAQTKKLVSSTTYGFITNASMVHLPGQPGLKTPHFKMRFNIQPGNTLLKFPKKKFKGGPLHIPGTLANLLYNDIFRFIVNTIVAFVVSVFNLCLQAYLYIPLTQLMIVFDNGIQLLQTTMVHPIVAMAFMGSAFINASVDIWLNLITFTIIFAVIGGIGWAIMVGMILPFLASWLGVMTGVGFIDAYYVPFVPYMIFTFGSIAWLMAVIESMVAGPIVALGVTHPEGHDALGKAEQAIMILVNIFLRPAMMIIGYISAIALSYVAVFVLNSGFSQLMTFLLPEKSRGMLMSAVKATSELGKTEQGALGSPYYNWTAVYAVFFCLVTYTSLYLTVVQKSFTLIHALPDKILRWIGSQGESYGQDTAQWAEESKGQVKDAGEATGKSSMKTGSSVMSAAESALVSANKGASGGSSTAT